MSAHTPGPWTIDNTRPLGKNDAVTTVGTPMGGIIARLIHNETLHAEANARLIAAAPALLEALERIVKVYEAGDDVTAYLRVSEIANVREAVRSAK